MGKLNRIVSWLWAGLFLGLGFLTKGPIHLLFFYGLVIGAVVATRRWREFFSGAHLLGALLCFGLVLAWGIPFIGAYSEAMNVQGSQVLAKWQNEIASRATGAEDADVSDWLGRAPKALVMFLPWVLLVPLWWKRDALRAALPDLETRRTFNGLAWGIVGSFAIMMALPSVSARYVAPLIAPVALLSGWILGQNFQGSSKILQVWKWILALLAVLISLASLYLIWRTRDAVTWSLLAGGLLVLGALWQSYSGKHPVTRLTCLTALLVSLGMWGVDVVDRHHLIGADDIRPVSLQIKAAVSPKDGPLYVFQVGQVPYPFYMGADTIELYGMERLPESGIRWMLTTPRVAEELMPNFERRFGKLQSRREFAGTWGDTTKGKKMVLLRFAGLSAKS
jgi:4-amino-4-deoxy-L-arabinose transferase-like glycosyltransferase